MNMNVNMNVNIEDGGSRQESTRLEWEGKQGTKGGGERRQVLGGRVF